MSYENWILLSLKLQFSNVDNGEFKYRSKMLKSSNRGIHYPKECGLDSWHKETGRSTNRDFEVVKEQNKVVLERTAVEKKVMKYQYKC